MRVIVNFTVKFPVCSKPKTHAYGVFDCEFDYDSQEWSCSHRVTVHVDCSQNLLSGPNLVEMAPSFHLCEIDSIDLLDILRAVYVCDLLSFGLSVPFPERFCGCLGCSCVSLILGVYLYVPQYPSLGACLLP